MIGRPADEEKLSRTPRQIRNRLRRKHAKFNEDLAMLVNEAGYKPVSEWDLHELAKGKPRDKNGGFRGRPPAWITTEVVKEAKRRLLDETFSELSGYADIAVKTIVKLMKSEEVDDNGKPLVDARTKLAAATFVIEHILGKPKAIVEVEAADFTKRMLASAIVLDDGAPQDEPVVLEGEWEEEEDDDDGESEE